MSAAAALVLRNARLWEDGPASLADVAVEGAASPRSRRPDRPRRARVKRTSRAACCCPGLVNAHDHLDFSTFPFLGRPPYASVYEWAADVDGGASDRRPRRRWRCRWPTGCSWAGCATCWRA